MNYKLFKDIPRDKVVKGYWIEYWSNNDKYDIREVEIQTFPEKHTKRNVLFENGKKYWYWNEWKEEEKIFFTKKDVINEYRRIMNTRIARKQNEIKESLILRNQTDEEIKNIIR